jgi:hypothetical protein
VVVSLVDGTVVAASEVGGAEVGGDPDVGSAGRVDVGVGLGIAPHPAASMTDRTDSESASLRIVASLSKNEGLFYHKATNSATTLVRAIIPSRAALTSAQSCFILKYGKLDGSGMQRNG